MHAKTLAMVAAGLLVAPATDATAAGGDPTRRAERLEPLNIDASDGFSVKSYALETGVYYRWRIEADGLEEYKLLAPELFRESWIDQVVIEDKEVKPFGLHAVEFDDEGTIDIWFIPQRPGRYPFYVDHLRDLGFEGVVTVK